MDNEAGLLLDDVIEFCRRDGQEQRLINMLEQCGAESLEEDTLTVRVPSRFAYSYLIKQRQTIEAYLEEIAFGPIALEVVCDGPGARGGGAGASTQEVSRPLHPTPATPSPIHAEGEPVPYDPMAPSGYQVPSPQEIPQAAPRDEEPVIPPARRPFPMAGHEDAAGERPINVRNTIGAGELLEIQRRMEGSAPATSANTAPRPPQTVETAADDAGADINSKFTFENFVSGDENKHAYNSAMRFAAYADVPGQAPSLFIYGNSGLGKTHLLFAIKNYLAAEMPHLRVKYANSQAYFEDYLHELSVQKGAGGMIMREYREADILIIDDIQNIVNKQATIEFFFQLVDGFIRSGKKIVIASDRAPKKLGLDERLTSRFNAGMLCLVSEPGFEMKYLILKRYYENVIVGSSDVATINAGTSLLSALQVREGHLTDEQLRHMAEISGNNIRSLESFCERCAGMSSEKEAEGGELTAEDIDRVANQYFDTARKVIHIDTVQEVVEEYYHVSHEDLIGPRRTANIAFARHVAVYLANNLCEMTTPAIGSEFGGRDHSTVLNSIKVVESKMKDDRRICDDLQNLKNKIILKS